MAALWPSGVENTASPRQKAEEIKDENSLCAQCAPHCHWSEPQCARSSFSLRASLALETFSQLGHGKMCAPAAEREKERVQMSPENQTEGSSKPRVRRLVEQMVKATGPMLFQGVDDVIGGLMFQYMNQFMKSMSRVEQAGQGLHDAFFSESIKENIHRKHCSSCFSADLYERHFLCTYKLTGNLPLIPQPHIALKVS